MNFSMARYILGWVLEIESAFMLLPCIVSVIYGDRSGLTFLITGIIGFIIGFLLVRKKPKNISFYGRDGFIIVGLSWILLSVVGAAPFTISGEIPNYIDACFETVSGFTTTGATILTNVEGLSHTCLFWRSFTHWLGGMGVCVFILTILPLSGGNRMHLMRAESPGPTVGKLVPKVKTTAMYLYGIYIVMTLIQIILMIICRMPAFDAICIGLGTAGTGGFGIKNDSIASYSPLLQWIITVFMILFGVNFNVYFYVLRKEFRNAFKLEEVKAYLGIIIFSTLVITFNIWDMSGNFGTALKDAAFQVGSVITTTGYSTVDFDLWPTLSKSILVVIMFVGACAGSTGGGIKVSRFIIAYKAIRNELEKFIHPRSVNAVKVDGKAVEKETERSVFIYFLAFALIFIFSLLVISLDNFDFTSSFTAVAATINNIGPGLGKVGPMGGFAEFSWFSKLVFIFDMLIGRLEIYPMLMLIWIPAWKKH